VARIPDEHRLVGRGAEQLEGLQHGLRVGLGVSDVGGANDHREDVVQAQELEAADRAASQFAGDDSQPDALLVQCQHRLGNRSALEWVIDQYQVTRDDKGNITSDPNRLDDEEYIVRLIGQVVTVSLETQRIVALLPSIKFD